MKESDIRKYATLMKELELTGLEIREDNKTVRLERALHTVTEPVIVQEKTKISEAINDNFESSDYVSVKSSIVGVFYIAPAEDAEPFVKIGDKVEAGQTLCIIEAMKLMNEVSTPEGGIIDKICVTNGQVVEYGTELFRIRR